MKKRNILIAVMLIILFSWYGYMRFNILNSIIKQYELKISDIAGTSITKSATLNDKHKLVSIDNLKASKLIEEQVKDIYSSDNKYSKYYDLEYIGINEEKDNSFSVKMKISYKPKYCLILLTRKDITISNTIKIKS